MNRRDFLKRMALAGLAVPSTRTIIDMGANLWKRPRTSFCINAFDLGAPSPAVDTLLLDPMTGRILAHAPGDGVQLLSYSVWEWNEMVSVRLTPDN